MTFGTKSLFSTSTHEVVQSSISQLDATHFVISYVDVDDSYKVKCVIGVNSGTTISSYGSEYVAYDGNYSKTIVKAIDSTHFILVYVYSNLGDYFAISVIGTITNGTEISFSSPVSIGKLRDATAFGVDVLDSTHIVVVYDKYNEKTTSKIGTLSSWVVSYGTEVNLTKASNSSINVVALDSTHFAIQYRDSNNGYKGYNVIGVVSGGNSITYGTEYLYYNGDTRDYSSIAKVDSTHFVNVYNHGSSSYNIFFNVGVVSNGDDIAYGDEYTLTLGGIGTYIDATYLNSTQIAVVFKDGSDSNHGKLILATLSNGDDLAFSTESAFLGDAAASYNGVSRISDTAVSIVFCQVGGTGGFAIIGQTIVGPANVKTYKGLASASVKTCKGLAIASVKTKKGLA